MNKKVEIWKLEVSIQTGTHNYIGLVGYEDRDEIHFYELRPGDIVRHMMPSKFVSARKLLWSGEVDGV